MDVRVLLTTGVIALGLLLQQQTQPTFRSGTELVRVDVTVLDRHGKPVTTLTADDFVVFQDGVPQKLQTFQLLSFSGPTGADEDLTLTIGPRENRPSEFAREDVRLFLIFWDEYHIQPEPQGKMLRDQLVAFIRTMMRPTDLVAIMDQWTPMSDLWFSRDRYRLANQAMALRGRLNVFYPPRNGAEENQLRGPRTGPFVREQVSLSALKSAIMHLATLRDSRKTVLYLGLDFHMGRDTGAATMDIIEAANASNVAVYSINPEGLRVDRPNFRSGILASIASSTGGESMITNTPSIAMERALSQLGASYLLGYAPSPDRQDGAYHKIEVKVKGDGYQVRARSGYVAPSSAERAAARTAAAEAELPTPIEAAFKELVRLDRPEAEDGPRDVHTILVPESPSSELSVVAPDLWLIRKPADLAAARGNTPPPVHTGRVFTRSDRILMRILIQGTRASEASIQIGLIDRRGKRLTDLPFTGTPSGWLLDLPFQSIARGDYLIAVDANAAGRRSTAYVPVKVRER